jgi:D-hexose-6-phosphate mutarotase
MPLVNRRLAGDFLCMPFGRDDVNGGPIHGLPANTPWDVIEQDVAHATLRLAGQRSGARR